MVSGCQRRGTAKSLLTKEFENKLKYPDKTRNMTEENLKEEYDFSDKEMGKGAFGSVCLATHKSLNERVAIKNIPLFNEKGKNMKRDAQIEFDIINKLTHGHKNIVKFYELIITEDGYYLVYELGLGGSLLDHLFDEKKGRFEENEARVLIL